MRIQLKSCALARLEGGQERPRADAQRHGDQTPPGPNGRNGDGHWQPAGVVVLVAAIVVLLWSDSLVVLALGTLLLALVLFASVLLVSRMRRRHTR